MTATAIAPSVIAPRMIASSGPRPSPPLLPARAAAVTGFPAELALLVPLLAEPPLFG